MWMALYVVVSVFNFICWASGSQQSGSQFHLPVPAIQGSDPVSKEPVESPLVVLVDGVDNILLAKITVEFLYSKMDRM